METKECIKCNVTKELNEYPFRKDTQKYRNECNSCIRERVNKRNENNKDILFEYHKKYQIDNKEKLKKKKQEYYLNNQETLKENSINYYKNNIDKIKQYKKDNMETILSKQRVYYNNRMKTDIVFKTKENVRKLIQISFKRNGFSKSTKTFEILGCSYEDFKNHLETNFEPWMNWKNYGLYNGTEKYGWDIDHIIPISSVTNEIDLIKLNHYSNLQPLCSKINRDIKVNKVGN